jgi:hypothetical protein
LPLHVKIAKILDPDPLDVLQATFPVRHRAAGFSVTVRGLCACS